MKKDDARQAYNALMKVYPSTTDDLDGEIWRDIDGYEERYQVSNYGRVKSFWRGAIKILKPAAISRGYLFVSLCKPNQRKQFYIHRLVAQAFIPNPDNKRTVNHIDGHRLNNCVENLEWATAAENTHHALAKDLIPTGELCPWAKIKNMADVVYIRENPDSLTGLELAIKFGVGMNAINNIQLGKTYKNAGGQIRKPNYDTRFKPKLTIEQRKQIRRLFIRGSKEFGVCALSRKYGVSHATILNILKESD